MPLLATLIARPSVCAVLARGGEARKRKLLSTSNPIHLYIHPSICFENEKKFPHSAHTHSMAYLVHWYRGNNAWAHRTYFLRTKGQVATQLMYYGCIPKQPLILFLLLLRLNHTINSTLQSVATTWCRAQKWKKAPGSWGHTLALAKHRAACI